MNSEELVTAIQLAEAEYYATAARSRKAGNATKVANESYKLLVDQQTSRGIETDRALISLRGLRVELDEHRISAALTDASP